MVTRRTIRRSIAAVGLLAGVPLSAAVGGEAGAAPPDETAIAPDAEPAPGAAGDDLVSGQAAIDRLEDGAPLDAPQLPDGTHMTRDDTIDLLASDDSVFLAGGRLVFVDEALPGDGVTSSDARAAELTADFALKDVPVSAEEAASAFELHSRPDSTKKIYLDFDGHGPSEWGEGHAAVDLDGDVGSLSELEREWIVRWWSRVAADFDMWDVDVTTEEPPAEYFTKSGPTDTTFGIRVILTSTFFRDDVRGVANVGTFASAFDDNALVIVDTDLNFYSEEYTPWVITHEVGHTLGLHHDGWSDPNSGDYDPYYSGHNRWAPIMGGGRLSKVVTWPEPRDVVQWSKGDYVGANNTEQDDRAIIEAVLGPVDDIHGAEPTPIESDAPLRGVINAQDDTDVFSMESGAGTVHITVAPTRPGRQLDVSLTVHDATGALVASQNRRGVGPESVAVDVPAGTYLVTVDGVGDGDVNTGYTDYSSVGAYEITATYPEPEGERVPGNAAQPHRIDFDGDGRTDVFTATPDGGSYRWKYSAGGVSAWRPLRASSQPVDELRFGDFDGDGTTDVFTASPSGAGYEWKYSSGGVSEWTSLGSFPESLDEVRFGDFDGDGATDVFAATRRGWRYRWRYWSPISREWADLGRSIERPDRLRFGDFDGDGVTDVFAAVGFGRWSYWRISWGGVSSWDDVGWVRASAGDVRLGDFDGDDATDVFTATGRRGSYRWRYWSWASRSWTGLTSSTQSVDGLAFGDFDGDGRVDVFTVTPAGSTSRWLYSSAGVAEWAELSTQGSERLSELRLGNPDDGRPRGQG